MDVKEVIQKLAEREFGVMVADIDFWGTLEGEDMMGELALNPGLSEDEIYERLDRIHREATQQGWRVMLDWVWDSDQHPVMSGTKTGTTRKQIH